MTDIFTNPAQAARTEIERLHAFIEGWFRGTMPKDTFAQGFANRLHAGFENVQPSGAVLSRADLLDPIRDAHGRNPDFRIKIRDVRLLGAWPEAKLIQASYIEAQTGARNSAADNDRRSTVLFESPLGRLIWRHLHETAVPQEEG
ncbi:MAG: hypothetical protein AAFV19_01265 [Pseudomonadota bacterium]